MTLRHGSQSPSAYHTSSRNLDKLFSLVRRLTYILAICEIRQIPYTYLQCCVLIIAPSPVHLHHTPACAFPYESNIGPKHATPLLSNPYTTFLVTFSLLSTYTASALTSVYTLYANSVRSCLPQTSVLMTIALGSVFSTSLTKFSPYVAIGDRVDQIRRTD
jgi:hypothetical protein